MLRGMTWDHPRGYACLEAASQRYLAETGNAISWDRRSLQAFADASIEDLAKTYDLIVLDHPHVGLIAETQCLLPLEPPVGDGSLGGSLESYIWKGELWAYPVDAACQVAVSRPDMQPVQLPHWEAVFEAKPQDFRMATPLLPVDAFDLLLTLVAGKGEEKLPFSETQFTSKANGVMALKVLKSLYRLGPPEAVGWNPIDVLEAMSTTDEFAYSPALFGYINYAREQFRPHKLEYVDLPSFADTGLKRGILGGAGIGVSARRGNAETARQFAAWVASEPVQSGIYIENEGQPANPATWNRLADDPRYSGFLKGARRTIDAAWTRPRDIWFLSFVDDACEIFPDFFRKDRDEEDFWTELNTLYRRNIAEAEK